jgi:excisionase family DNA binding protein
MQDLQNTNPFEIIAERLNAIEELLLKMKAPKKAEEPKKMISVRELAKQIGTSELTIRNWIKEGKLKAVRMGGLIFIPAGQFEESMEEVKSLKYKR